MFSLSVWGRGGGGQRQQSAFGFLTSLCGHWGLNSGWQICGKRLPLLSHLTSEHRYLNERMRLSESLAIDMAEWRAQKVLIGWLRSNALIHFRNSISSLDMGGNGTYSLVGLVRVNLMCADILMADLASTGARDGSLEQKVCRSRENPQILPLCLGFREEFRVLLFVFYPKRTNYLIIHSLTSPFLYL